MKKGQSRGTGNTGTQVEEKTKQKHNTICVGHYHTQANPNKTYVLSQTFVGKDEPNIVYMREEYHQKLIGKIFFYLILLLHPQCKLFLPVFL
jgi:hypothetical protein